MLYFSILKKASFDNTSIISGIKFRDYNNSIIISSSLVAKLLINVGWILRLKLHLLINKQVRNSRPETN
ncbi:hypothetical protein OCHUTO_0618 [Orientia chuto str. Dubai]|uniref:Uncharacterized protein n=1 Tax=Orientia chuto str. Dubai TaxID=1359168 RepID=A0A0F3MJS5_9RICK|nr:hypothetical protein OCHUTO_0618 [Orientia chuto str. Dubai]